MDGNSFQAQLSNTDIVAGLKMAVLLKDEEEKLKAYSKGFKDLGDWCLSDSDLITEDILKKNRMRLKAVCLYNLALASGGDQHTLVSKIQLIDEGIMRAAGSQAAPRPADEYIREIEDYKHDLHVVRKMARQHLSQIDIASIEVKTIYKNIAGGLKKLVTKMIEKCFELIPPPIDCQYSIVVLGSLARKEATPYSDLEWAILIGDDNKQHEEYFRRLTELVWIKILNLQETTPRMMDIQELEWFFETDSPCRKGFSFDGQMLSGCHTPLGNCHHTASKISAIEQSNQLSTEEKAGQIQNIKDGEYELIGTPEKLAQFQTQRWETKRGFCTVLSTVAPIISNSDDLILAYETNMAAIWNSKVESDPNQTLIQQRAITYLSESVERFKFKGGYFGKETHSFDAKYDLYRLPNMLIDHLASYFSIQKKNLWERIERIFGERGAVCLPEKSNTLKQMVSQVLGLRLRAYLQKGYRDDHIVMYDPQNPEKTEAAIQKYLGVDENLLLKILSALVELQWRIKSFIEQPGATTALDWDYGDMSDFTRGEVYHSLLNYPKAEVAYEKAKQIMIATHRAKHLLMAATLNNLGIVYESQGNLEGAEMAFKDAEQIIKETHNINPLSVAEVLINLGAVYVAQTKFEEAIKTLGNVKQIIEDNHVRKNPCIADRLNNLGAVYALQKRFREAIEAFEEAKQILMDTHDHLSVAYTLNNLGNVYQGQKRYLEALAAYEESNRIKMAIHGPEHVLVAETLNNLGVVYAARARYSDALAAYEEAKRIRVATLGAKHPSIARTLINLGDAYKLQARYPEAIEALEEAISIITDTYDPDHLLVAGAKGDLGQVRIELGQYKEARDLFNAALNVYTDTQHPDQKIANRNIWSSHIREGNSFMLQDQMDTDQASRCYVQAYPDQDPKDMLKPKKHQELADMFYATNQLPAAIEHYRILIRLTPNDASALHNLGSLVHAYSCIRQSKSGCEHALDNIREAEGYFERAVQLTSYKGVCVNAGVCTEYARFIWKNRVHYDSEKIIALLQAIALNQSDKRLGYGPMERATLDQYLQSLLDKENRLSFRAHYLAQYLLIQVYCATKQLSAAKDLCEEFQIQVNADKEVLPSEIATLSVQVSALIEENPDEKESIIEQAQQFQINIETQQRLHARLVEGSEAAIEQYIASKLLTRSPTVSPRLLRDSPILAREATYETILTEEVETSLNPNL